MREIDRLTVDRYRIPSLQLMQAAARACFQEVEKSFSGNLRDRKVLILCGPGNNGGDGATLAQELFRVGAHTELVLLGRFKETKGEARTNFEIARRIAESDSNDGAASFSFIETPSVEDWDNRGIRFQAYDIVVDALFGTGLTRPLEGIFSHVVQRLGTREIRAEGDPVPFPLVLSVDLPSGLNADLPKPIGAAVTADLTVTFTAPKPANVLPPACHLNGTLTVADIGSPATLLEEVTTSLFVASADSVTDWLASTRYEPEAFKNTHGHVLVIAGSRGYTGAAILCGNAAMRSGAGLVTIATPASAQETVAASVMPEVMTTALAETDRGTVSEGAIDHVMQLARKVSVIAIGPGLSSADERTRRFVKAVVTQRETPVVIDADALNCLAPWPFDSGDTQKPPLVLTPHQGEMLRLLGTDDRAALDDRVAVALAFATRHNLILVLKGSRTLIAGSGCVVVNPTGNAGLGTAGAGDTLTGIIAGFISQAVATLKASADARLATISAVYIGGLAGDFAAADLGMRAMVASDIQDYLSQALLSLDPEGERP